MLISNFSNYCYNLCKEEILFDIKFFYEWLEIEFILKMLEIFNKYVNFFSWMLCCSIWFGMIEVCILKKILECFFLWGWFNKLWEKIIVLFFNWNFVINRCIY